MTGAMPVPFFAFLVALSAAAVQPEAFRHAVEEPRLNFTYGWPAVVEDEPALRAVLAQDMAEAEAQARRDANEDQEARRDSDFPLPPHSFSRIWIVAGATPQLLSLTSDLETYTGGAHGGLTHAALLWDRAADSRVEAADLLGEAALARLTPRFCAKLDAERAERRGQPADPQSIDSFSRCPELANLPLAPTDVDGNGRFDTLRVLIAPYEAGPWVEGNYVIDLPFEAEDLAGLNEGFRPAFEAGGEASFEDPARG